MLTAPEVELLDQRFSLRSAEEVLAWTWAQFGRRAAIGTSFQGSGLVIMHLARQLGLRFPVFTLDTGLLFVETNILRRRLEDFFGFPIEVLKPDLTVEQQAQAHSPELWKRDPDLCCTMRKVLPLQNKLRDLDAWITGLRREQSDSRSAIGTIELYEFDPLSAHDILKINPLAAWSREAVWEYIRKHQIPYNPLHDQGYRSIGCWPCTQKTQAGASDRAGRWTGFNKTECGIHTFMARKG